MNFRSAYLPFAQTGAYTAIVLDYLRQEERLRPFFSHTPDIEGIRNAIAQRKNIKTDRVLLVNELRSQYRDLSQQPKVNEHIDLLLQENTFSVTTAHQPNIFTGHLYFLYKILHAIKLADELRQALPDCNFVPVFYMGSEDADLDELGQVSIGGEGYRWETAQKGAVGRMKVDKAIVQMMEDISGQLLIHPHGQEIMALMKDCYIPGASIQDATLKLVHALFGEYGLLVLMPDNANLKRAFNPIVEKELLEQFSHKAVAETVAAFPETYKVQAAGRDLNLFYFKDDLRERFVQNGDTYLVSNTRLSFTKEAILQELEEYPERFSANVILRPLFQEMILPNIAFIGGGGELAYWLELKRVFEAVSVPFPVLLLRNSFMIIDKADAALQEKLGLSDEAVFGNEADLFTQKVKESSIRKLKLDNEKESLAALYDTIQTAAVTIDVSLQKHTEALRVQALHKLNELEKKMLRAEKRKHEAVQRQLHKLKAHLFPHNSLQERVDNLMPFYAKWGRAFIEIVYQSSQGLNQQFCILTEEV